MKRYYMVMMSFVLSFWFAVQCYAQEYPNSPINLIVGTGPGAITDSVSRIFAEEAKKNLGVDVLVQNKPGASFTVSVSAVMSARPDGYTIGFATDTPFIRAPHLMKLNFSPLKDTLPIAFLAEAHNLIVVKADSPFKSIKEMIDYAKSNPGKLTYGHAGVGMTHYLGFAGLIKQANLNVSFTAFQGDGQSLLAVLGGHVMAAGAASTPCIPHIKAGKLRVLAIVDGTEQVPGYSGIPTLSEFTGTENAIPSLGFVVFGQNNLPKPIVSKIEMAFTKASKSEALAKWGKINEVFPLDKPIVGKELRDYLEQESRKMRSLIERLGLLGK